LPREEQIMVSNVSGWSRRFLALLGLCAVFGTLVFTDTAEAVRSKSTAFRPAHPGKLKKPAASSPVRPNVIVKYPNLAKLGLTVVDNGGNGCQIKAVLNGSAADQAGLQPNDVIVAVEDITVRTCADADDLIGQAIALRFSDVVLGVKDQGVGQPVGVDVDLRNLPQAVRAKAKTAKAKR
jgi:S1-C subfamily serine protease